MQVARNFHQEVQKLGEQRSIRYGKVAESLNTHPAPASWPPMLIYEYISGTHRRLNDVTQRGSGIVKRRSALPMAMDAIRCKSRLRHHLTCNDY